MTKYLDIPLPNMPGDPPRWVQPPKYEPEPPPPPHPLSPIVGDWIRDALWQASFTRERTLQRAIGPSQLGGLCARQLAYQRNEVPPVNFPDPLRSDVGTWMHVGLAATMRDYDGGSGRFLVEQRVSYKGVRGTCDLYDRRRKMVLDWKGTVMRSRKMRQHGAPEPAQLVQIAIYALALRAIGESVEYVALAYVPFDGELNDIRVWVSPLTDELIDRAETSIARATTFDRDPAAVSPTPSNLCPWCAWYRPGSPDLSTACPAEKE